LESNGKELLIQHYTRLATVREFEQLRVFGVALKKIAAL